MRKSTGRLGVMKSNKLDRRVQYTRMILRQSLLELMKERSINKITVTDICELAEVNRGTFYAHYSDPYDLLHQIEKELYSDIIQSLERSLKSDSIQVLLQEIFQSIEKNGDLCKILFSEYGDKEFIRELLCIVHDKCMDEWQQVAKHVDRSQLEWLYTFTANGSVGIIQAWVQGGMKESPTDIAQFIYKISSLGLQVVM